MPRHSLNDAMPKPIPRCCASHQDWPTLAQHVCDSFPRLSTAAIARELRVAREAVAICQLGEDALRIAELIARHRLMIAAGQIAEDAKLDPQRHSRRTSGVVT